MEGSIVTFIASKLNKKLTNAEIEYITNTLEKKEQLRVSIPKIIKNIKKGISSEPYNYRQHVIDNIGTVSEDLSKPHQFDIDIEQEELNQQRLNTQISFFLNFTKDKLFQLSKRMNPSSKYYYQYIYFDTYSALSELSTETEFSWNLNDGPPVFESGTINLSRKTSNIVAMRLGRMQYSFIDSATFQHLLPSLSTSLRTAVYFKSFAAQSMIAPNGIRFHFLQLYLANNGSYVTTSSFEANRGWFRFHTPHNLPKLLTLSVYDIFNTVPLSIANDYVSVPGTQIFLNIQPEAGFFVDQPLYVESPYFQMFQIFYTYANEAGIEYSGGGTMLYEVTLSGFTTGDPVADAAEIAAYNTDHLLTLAWSDGTEGYFDRPVDLTGIDTSYPNPSPPPALIVRNDYPVTITFKSLPRLVGKLELVCEKEPGEKVY